jgi:WD40 repeat protein
VAFHSQPGSIWNLDTGQAVLHEPMNEWCFSLDSTKAAILHPGGTIGVFDLLTGKETQRLQKTGTPQTLAFAPNGRQLAAGYRNERSAVKVYDLASGSIITELSGTELSGKRVWSLAWHPDGQRLAGKGGVQVPANQPGRAPAGRGHERRRPPLGTSQRPRTGPPAPR